MPLPNWTPPDAEGRPIFQAIGRDEPGPVRGEIPGRRHGYRRDGENVRFKIKRSSGTAYLNFYKVRRPGDGATGWQALKPTGFVPAPYTGPSDAPDPFAEGSDFEVLHWPEGERDVDTLRRLGLCAFSFGGASDLPECSDLLRGRDVVVLADNDDDGEKCLARKVAMALPVASRVRVVRFPDLATGGDVTLWMEEHGGSPAGLLTLAMPVTPGAAGIRRDRGVLHLARHSADLRPNRLHLHALGLQRLRQPSHNHDHGIVEGVGFGALRLAPDGLAQLRPRAGEVVGGLSRSEHGMVHRERGVARYARLKRAIKQFAASSSFCSVAFRC